MLSKKNVKKGEESVDDCKAIYKDTEHYSVLFPAHKLCILSYRTVSNFSF